MSTHSSPEHDEHADAPVDAHDEHEEGSEGKEHGEASDLDTILKGIKLVGKVTDKVTEDGPTIETVASAVKRLRNSTLFWPLKTAFNTAPAAIQRFGSSASHTGGGEFLLKYMPALHLQSYMPPFMILAILMKCGVFTFKLNEEEEKEMMTTLGETATEEQKMAYRAKKQKEIIDRIVLPGEGYAELGSSKAAKVGATVQPEFAPVVAVSEGVNKVSDGVGSFLASVRERANEMEIDDLKAKEAAEHAKNVVPTTVVEEHNAVAAVASDAHIPPLPTANNSDHYNQSAAA